MRPTLDMQGVLIGGRYQLQELVGEGGMGGVWKAHDETLQRSVALKLLFSGDERDRDQRVSRFLREARIAAAVQHRNVVHIVDFGSTEGGRPYMVMEFLKGETLAERLARTPAPTVEELARLVSQTLGGLAAAHDAGVVHRDMKPENVFLVDDADGAYPKILDFGISRSLAPESGPSSALTTREGFLVGTPQYMSPEQARGLKDVDRLTDIYSIGVILYESLTGKLPFNSEHMGDLIILIAAGNTPTLSEVREDIGEPISEVVRKSMSVDREVRYPDARAMRKALTAALERMDPEARALPCRTRQRRSLVPPKPTAATTDGRAKATVKEKSGGEEAPGLAKTLPATPSLPDIGTPAATPSTDSIETPKAWTVNQRAPSSGGGGRALVAIALVAAVGVGGYFALQGDSTGDRDARRGRTSSTSTPATPQRVTFTFEGAPPSATITVDGEVVEGNEHELERDDRPHMILVVDEGMQPLEIPQSAHEDALVRVRLIPLEPAEGEPDVEGEPGVEGEPDGEPVAEVAEPEPTMRARMRGMRGMRTMSMAMGAPTVLDMLDY